LSHEASVDREMTELTGGLDIAYRRSLSGCPRTPPCEWRPSTAGTGWCSRAGPPRRTTESASCVNRSPRCCRASTCLAYSSMTSTGPVSCRVHSRLCRWRHVPCPGTCDRPAPRPRGRRSPLVCPRPRPARGPSAATRRCAFQRQDLRSMSLVTATRIKKYCSSTPSRHVCCCPIRSHCR